MQIFTVTAHIALDDTVKVAPSQQPIRTGLISMAIPAKDESEARIKARRFLYGKIGIVVDSCVPKTEDKTASWLDESEKQFREIFKNWPRNG